MHALTKSLTTITAALTLAFSGLSAQSFQSASDQAKQDLNKALSELNDMRAAIAKEKIPLIREVSSLEDDLSLIHI